MKAKKISISITAFLLLLFSATANAQEAMTVEHYFNRAGTKLVSGIANVATGWMELPKTISIWTEKENDPLTGWLEGIFRGVVHVASRTGSGALDVATFLLPTLPTPVPVVIWEDFSQQSEYHAFRM